MLTSPRRIVLCNATAAILLASCSQSETAEGFQAAGSDAREFSEQDKTVARVLSLGNDSAIEEAEGSYAEAVLCSGAINAIVVRLNDSGRSSADIVEALRQAQRLYEMRLHSLATGEGKSQNDIDRDVQQAAIREVASAANARVVLGCIKKLEQAS